MALKGKLIKVLSALGIAATLFSAPAYADYVPTYEPDSGMNPTILNAGDWAITTLTQNDHDYYKLSNDTSDVKRYRVLLQSPSGYDYRAYIFGAHIKQTLSIPGQYEWNVSVYPGYSLTLNVFSRNGAYTDTDTYFVTVNEVETN